MQIEQPLNRKVYICRTFHLACASEFGYSLQSHFSQELRYLTVVAPSLNPPMPTKSSSTVRPPDEHHVSVIIFYIEQNNMNAESKIFDISSTSLNLQPTLSAVSWAASWSSKTECAQQSNSPVTWLDTRQGIFSGGIGIFNILQIVASYIKTL